MTDTGDLPKPSAKDIAVRPSTTATPLTDAASGSLPERISSEQRFFAQVKRWLHPDSPNTLSVRFPDEEFERPHETRIIPGKTKRFIFVDSPDGKMRIGLFADIPNDPKDPFRAVEVKWLDRENRRTGEIEMYHYASGTDHFSQMERTDPSPLDINLWEQEGGRTIGRISPSQNDMLPDLTTVLEGGTYNDTLTQNALRYFTEQQQATRITSQEALTAGEGSPQLPPSPTKAIEQ